MKTLSSLPSTRTIALVGTASAALLFVCVNILVSRFHARWDWTAARLYSLSTVTMETLEQLEQPIEVVVFLSRADPLSHSVGKLLDAYRAHSSLLQTRFVDPDREPAEFIALQQKYGIFEGRTENGRLATEASIVLSRLGERWFITTDDIVVFDEEDGLARPRLEQALTEGLVNLLGKKTLDVCVTQGHRELDFDTTGPHSLAQFRSELERNNHAVRGVDLASPDPAQTLIGCRLVVLAGPSVPFAESAAERLRRHTAEGGSVFALVGPVTDDEGRTLDPGLGVLLEPLGIEFERNLVFEGDERYRLPVGMGGEVFLATPVDHATTRGFFRHGAVEERVLLQLAQGLSLSGASQARPILETSERGFSVDGFRELRNVDLPEVDDDAPRRHIVAAAVEAKDPPRDDGRPRSRLLLVGTPSLLWSSTFDDPALSATRRFVENAVAWLTERRAIVSVPEKPSHPAGLNLTEDAVSEVQRYVLLYMPLCAALVGALLVYRRRKELPD